MMNHAMLVDEEAGALHVWGGRPSWRKSFTGSPTLYTFHHSDTWDPATNVENYSIFESAQRTEYPAFSSTQIAGFIFGGRVTPLSQGEGTPASNPNHYISLDFKTREWKNHRDAPYSVDGILWGGQALFVPDFGPNGLIFVLGGMRGRGDPDPTYLMFDELHFIDPVTHEWYTQRTTANDFFPKGRHLHCVVGASGGDACEHSRSV